MFLRRNIYFDVSQKLKISLIVESENADMDIFATDVGNVVFFNCPKNDNSSIILSYEEADTIIVDLSKALGPSIIFNVAVTTKYCDFHDFKKISYVIKDENNNVLLQEKVSLPSLYKNDNLMCLFTLHKETNQRGWKFEKFHVTKISNNPVATIVSRAF